MKGEPAACHESHTGLCWRAEALPTRTCKSLPDLVAHDVGQYFPSYSFTDRSDHGPVEVQMLARMIEKSKGKAKGIIDRHVVRATRNHFAKVFRHRAPFEVVLVRKMCVER